VRTIGEEGEGDTWAELQKKKRAKEGGLGRETTRFGTCTTFILFHGQGKPKKKERNVLRKN